MADVVVAKTLSDNKYKVEVYVNNILTADQALLDDFGEPTVVIGGLIDIANPGNTIFPALYVPNASASFSVTSAQKRIYSQMTEASPITYILDADTTAEAEEKALDVATHIQYKIQTAWDTLSALVDNFTDNDPGTVTTL